MTTFPVCVRVCSRTLASYAHSSPMYLSFNTRLICGCAPMLPCQCHTLVPVHCASDNVLLSIALLSLSLSLSLRVFRTVFFRSHCSLSLSLSLFSLCSGVESRFVRVACSAADQPVFRASALASVVPEPGGFVLEHLSLTQGESSSAGGEREHWRSQRTG
jgi:hypothetical protein